MKKYFWKQEKFYGLSDDSKLGRVGAFRYGIGANVRSDTGFFTVAGKPILHSGSSVKKEIDWIVDRQGTNEVYNYGEDTIYLEKDGAYSAVRVLGSDSPNGQGMCEFNGSLYYRTSTELGKYDYSTFNDTYQSGFSTCRKWSPMCTYLNMLLIGHGRYIATLDDIGTFTLRRLTLMPGYNVRHIFKSG